MLKVIIQAVHFEPANEFFKTKFKALEFAFASFFPNVIQPPVAVFGNTLFSLLGKKRVIN